MTNVIYIPPVGPITVGPVIDPREYVGGYVEWAGLTPHLGMLVAEHGRVGPFNTPPFTTKPKDFYALNVRATWLYVTYRSFNPIMGNAIVCGEPYFDLKDIDNVQPTRQALTGLFSPFHGNGICDWCKNETEICFDESIKIQGRDSRVWGYTCAQCAIDASHGDKPRLGIGRGQIMVPIGELDKLNESDKK